MTRTTRSSILLAVMFAILAVAAPAIARTPQAQIASLKKQLAAAKTTDLKLRAQNAKLAGLYATERTWFAQAEKTIAAQAPGGTAAIIAGGPDAMWNAVVAIWAMFPILTIDSHCGYTKTSSTTGGPGPITSSLVFEQITSCSG
ncbi:MAG TPA: hypothetical protein VGF46_00410 [Gaiellales bacterium]|jgi:hypothetical protein